MLDSPKYIFVSGGVTSSLGKGIMASSLAALLQARGYSVTIQKFDPYINIDPGTLNPYEHGECFVTEDGAETDLDLGHYERYLNVPTSQANNVTTGRIYLSVIERERKGDFLGKTVQVIPHITDEIKRRMKLLAEEKKYDFIITELGGTVGDIESFPYVEAVRQMKWEMGDDCLVIHLTYIPFLSAAKELKTKPTQHSVKTMLEAGVQPDILVCRTERPFDDTIRAKIALFCNVKPSAVIQSENADTIYAVPLLMQEERLDEVVLSKLNIKSTITPNMDKWIDFLYKLRNPKKAITIGLIGKYVELQDSYKSILESFIHAGVVNECKVKVELIHSEKLTEESVHSQLNNLAGILVAPGFGGRGIEGKILAVKYARENKIPFLGICLGMQCAVIEFARNVLGFKDAHTTEIEPSTEYPVIDLMEEQKTISNLGGTMRLGSYPCELTKESLIYDAYKSESINERHRHRFEFNNKYLNDFNNNGMKTIGVNPNSKLIETIELENHPWFVGVQYHPEYKSTVANPHPLFVKFVEMALKFKN